MELIFIGITAIVLATLAFPQLIVLVGGLCNTGLEGSLVNLYLDVYPVRAGVSPSATGMWIIGRGDLNVGRLEVDLGCAVFFETKIGVHTAVLRNVLHAIH
jgi:hypothetical protein